MRPFAVTCWVLFTLACWPAIAQRKTAASQTDTIPFQLTAFNNLVLKAIINNRDTIQLMLHTAASGVTLTDSARSKLKTLAFNRAVDSVKSWGAALILRLSAPLIR